LLPFERTGWMELFLNLKTNKCRLNTSLKMEFISSVTMHEWQ